MTSHAIRIESLGKRYVVDHEAQMRGYKTLRESLVDWAHAPLRRIQGKRRVTREEFWALRDVTFEVKVGDVVGIIGRNGAGKSTLLKVLSRITKPTAGRVQLNGRVGSLLEVGTGFHPELTGRENIFLNGSILGMSKREITRKFDAIVDFSGVEQFLDTPVKRYSSGMYVRLAFAVAAHLEPEMLIIDEVLAVGDAEFQRKCLGKMEEVASHGRTVLFVSHNMSAVQSLCSRGIFLEKGKVVLDSSVAEVTGHYLRTVEELAKKDVRERTDRRGSGRARIRLVSIRTSADVPEGTLVTGAPARFVIGADRFISGLECSFKITDQYGHSVTNFDTRLRSPEDGIDENLDSEFACEIDSLPLRTGQYRVSVALHCGTELLDHVESASVFAVESGTYFGRPSPSNSRRGSVWLQHRWSTPGSRAS